MKICGVCVCVCIHTCMKYVHGHVLMHALTCKAHEHCAECMETSYTSFGTCIHRESPVQYAASVYTLHTVDHLPRKHETWRQHKHTVKT